MKAPLPIRDGVAPSYLWLPAGEWPNMLTFLSEHFTDVTPATWQARMLKNEVVDAAGKPLAPDSPYRKHICIFYYRELEGETPIPFEEHVLYQDEHILVVDKPHFLPVIPTGRFLHETLLVRLKKKTLLENLTPIHRLDRETAGVIIFSHNLASRGTYQSLFQKQAMKKIYEAVAPSMPNLRFPLTYKSRLVDGVPFFRSQEVSGLFNAETSIDVIENRGTVSLYQLRPVTGKKHQLRVHLAALGMPILNDPLYPELSQDKGDDMTAPLQLVARSIAFIDPLTGTERMFSSLRKL